MGGSSMGLPVLRLVPVRQSCTVDGDTPSSSAAARHREAHVGLPGAKVRGGHCALPATSGCGLATSAPDYCLDRAALAC